MSINRPSWPHSAIEVLELINKELVQRLNSAPRPQGLWTIEKGQLNLSKASGGLRIVWSILGGPIKRGHPFGHEDPEQPAPCVAFRRCRLRADIGTDNPNTVGITADDIQQAEEVLRALMIVWNNQRPADYDDEEQQERWDQFTGEPGQRRIVCQYEVTCLLTVLGDPTLYKTITEADGTTVVGAPP
jgi:hypothetical protein